MIITVVRHLEPEPYSHSCPDVDRPLSQAGVSSASSLLDNVSAALSYRNPTHPMMAMYGYGYVSPYARCVSTASLIRSAVGDSWSWYETPLLRESPHISQRDTIRRKALSKEESIFDLRDRVSRFLTMIHDSVSPVLIVTHGDVVNAFRWCIEGLSLRQFRDLFDYPDNFVPFGVAWTFDTSARTAERRVLGSTEPDKVVEIGNPFLGGSKSYDMTRAEFVG